MNKQVWLLIIRSGNEAVDVFAFDSKDKAAEKFAEYVSEMTNGLLQDKLNEMNDDKENQLDWMLCQSDSWFHFRNNREGLIYDLSINRQSIM